MQAKEWSGLRNIIQRLRKQTRWQVYVRVLPVVFFAVILVGTFGTIAFTGYESAQLVANERNESTYLLETLRQKAIIETLSFEARRSDLMLGAALPAAIWGGSDPLDATGSDEAALTGLELGAARQGLPPAVSLTWLF